MDALLEMLNQGSPSDEKTIKDKLNRKFDVILAAGINVVPHSKCTQLQSAMGKILGSPSKTFAVAVFMAVQSENIPEICEGTFLQQCRAFFSETSSSRTQLLNSHLEVSKICQKIIYTSQRAGHPKMAIRTLMQAALLMAPEPCTLTPIHALLLQACISAKMYNLAVDFLQNNDILEIDPKSTSLTSQDYLEFFYYGGLCFLGVRKFTAALDYFQQAITLPAQALSAIVIACLKASKFASLIESGTAYEVPKYASQVVHRFYKQDMPVYDALACKFLSSDIPGMLEAIDAGTDVLTEDHNLGLAKQLISSRRVHIIRNLTFTYTTLSLQDITSLIGLEDCRETERFLFKMIYSGEITAKIEQQTSMVRFSTTEESKLRDKEKVAENEVALLRLEQHISDTFRLSGRLRDTHAALIVSEKFVSRSGSKGHHVGDGIGMGSIGHAGESVGWMAGDM